MAGPNLQGLLDIAVPLARKAGQQSLKLRADKLVRPTEKSAQDFVTNADKDAEYLIVDGIVAKRPSDGIMAEEGARRDSTNGITWIIDPLDGTRNFIEGNPFGVVIAAVYDSEPIASVIYLPVTDDIYSAAKDLGAKRNGRPISVKKNDAQLDNSTVVVGQPYDPTDAAREKQVIDKLNQYAGKTENLGAAVLGFCGVAEGTYDAYAHRGLQIWDVAAGLLIAQEAGAEILTPFSEWLDNQDIDSQDLVFGHPSIVADLGKAWNTSRVTSIPKLPEGLDLVTIAGQAPFSPISNRPSL